MSFAPAPSPPPSASAAPPDEIDVGPVLLVRSSLADAAPIAAAIGDSLDHLRPWMPWATAEAATVANQLARLRHVDQSWRAGTEYIYELRPRAVGSEESSVGEAGSLVDRSDQSPSGDRPVLGGIGLHRRIGEGGIEIGYWLRAGQEGNGYMTAAVRAVTAVARGLEGVERIEIHTDEANRRSAAIPARLGYRFDRVEERTPQAPAETGRLQIWMLP